MSSITCPSLGFKLSRSFRGITFPKPLVVKRGSARSQRPALARASDKQLGSNGGDRVVEQTRTYNESEGKVYSKIELPEDEEGSIALLVPGGRVSDRPSQAGGAAAAARREQNKPLKINTDLQLYRARQKGIQAKLLPASNQKLRKSQQVEQDLRSVLARDPTDERTYVLLGTYLLRQRRTSEARSVYEEGCAVAEGKNAFIWTAMANLERKEGNYAPARKYFQAAVTADDTHGAAYHGWGELEKRAGRLDAARNVLLQGIRQAKADPSPYLFVSIAKLALRTGLVGEARYWLREGTNTKRGAGSNALWTTWANMEWKQAGDAEAAAYCFDMALRSHSRSRYAFLSYAMMEKALGNYAAAQRLLRRGAQLNPTDAPLRQAYGVMLAEDRQYGLARQQFKAAAAADEYHLPVWQAWAVMELRAKNYERARQLFQRGVWAAPKDPNLVWLWQAWGCMEAELGNLAAARGLFKAAIGIAPENDAVWEAWIKMEEDNDLLDRANALRSHRFELAERSALPPSFTTLPAEGGAVIGTVKKWMQRFIQTEGPSTVYTPPPGKSPEDPLQDASRQKSRTSGALSQRRRPRDDSGVVQPVSKRSPSARAARASDASSATTGSEVESDGSADVPHAADMQREGGAAPQPEGSPQATVGPMAEVRVVGVHAGAGGVAEGAARLNGSDAVAGADEGGTADLGALQKPMRGRSQSVGGRVERPHWRRGTAEAGRGGPPAAADSSSGGTVSGEWKGQWGNGGPSEPLREAGADLNGLGRPIPAAVGWQDVQKNGSRNGSIGGSSAVVSPEGGGASIADGPGSEPAVR